MADMDNLQLPEKIPIIDSLEAKDFQHINKEDVLSLVDKGKKLQSKKGKPLIYANYEYHPKTDKKYFIGYTYIYNDNTPQRYKKYIRLNRKIETTRISSDVIVKYEKEGNEFNFQPLTLLERDYYEYDKMGVVDLCLALFLLTGGENLDDNKNNDDIIPQELQAYIGSLPPEVNMYDNIKGFRLFVLLLIKDDIFIKDNLYGLIRIELMKKNKKRGFIFTNPIIINRLISFHDIILGIPVAPMIFDGVYNSIEKFDNYNFMQFSNDGTRSYADGLSVSFANITAYIQVFKMGYIVYSVELLNAMDVVIGSVMFDKFNGALYARTSHSKSEFNRDSLTNLRGPFINGPQYYGDEMFNAENNIITGKFHTKYLMLKQIPYKIKEIERCVLDTNLVPITGRDLRNVYDRESPSNTVTENILRAVNDNLKFNGLTTIHQIITRNFVDDKILRYSCEFINGKKHGFEHMYLDDIKRYEFDEKTNMVNKDGKYVITNYYVDGTQVSQEGYQKYLQEYQKLSEQYIPSGLNQPLSNLITGYLNI
jgi:hypothetical protein